MDEKKKREFLKWLRSRRKSGETLQSIADEFGVSRQAVHKWLRGANRPSAGIVMLAAIMRQHPNVMTARKEEGL